MYNYDFSKFHGIDMSKLLENIQPYTPLIPIFEMPEIAEEDTMWYCMEKQYELLKKQLDQQNRHNEILTQNYNQLKELFDLQKGEYDAAKLN
ncbi:MAG: hypothetical protein WCD89_12670 [Anaerocolumna sp.]